MRTRSISFILIALCASGCVKKSSLQTVDTGGASTTATVPASAHYSQSTAAVAIFDAKQVSLHNLPDSVRPFVAKYFPDYTIAAASYDPLCGGAPAIDVAIRAKGKPAYSVIFLPNGHYVQREQDVPLATIPSMVVAAVKATYAGFRPGKQAEKLVLADNTTQYSVDLFQPHNQREAIFTSTGKVLCEGKE